MFKEAHFLKEFVYSYQEYERQTEDPFDLDLLVSNVQPFQAPFALHPGFLDLLMDPSPLPSTSQSTPRDLLVVGNCWTTKM